MNRITPISKENANTHLIGIGLDCEDGHSRVTGAEEFSIIGGSEKTHECMTETICKTMEDLKNNGKTLRNVEENQLRDMLQKNIPD
ncbi:MAG: hypothetical protein HOK49_12075 [Opitutae bacterium]|nr:hypothetical protein [Opitutae bacterium]